MLSAMTFGPVSVIEHAQTEPLLGFEELVQIAPAIARALVEIPSSNDQCLNGETE